MDGPVAGFVADVGGRQREFAITETRICAGQHVAERFSRRCVARQANGGNKGAERKRLSVEEKSHVSLIPGNEPFLSRDFSRLNRATPLASSVRPEWASEGCDGSDRQSCAYTPGL